MRVRRGTASDAGSVAAVHVRSWQAAYRGHLPRTYLDGLDPDERIERWERTLTAADWPRSGTLVAETHEGIVGFAPLCPTRDTDGDPATVGEIASMYLLPSAWGQGFGRRLMEESLTTLASGGYQQATLWVLDTNERARHFYEAGGWLADGVAKQVNSRGVLLSEVRYRRRPG